MTTKQFLRQLRFDRVPNRPFMGRTYGQLARSRQLSLADETTTEVLCRHVGERNDADANLVYENRPARRGGSSHINDTVIAGLMTAIAGALRSRLMPMPSEREKLVLNIDSLKESISLAWTVMISKPMTAAERGELRKSIDLLVKDLDNLRSKLDRLPKTQA